ncbi:DUF58 domain-containing protein [soil metagenome]
MTILAFRRGRSPARPGPGPVPEAVLRALEFTVARKIEGLLPGEHRSASQGIGTELTTIRPYQPGDDVRRIDWNVTARTNQAHVRVDIAERTLTAWLLLDSSPSMSFGTADRRKWDVAEGVAMAIGHLASRRGGRLGVLTYGGPDPITHLPRPGRAGLRGVLVTTQTEIAENPTGPTSLGSALTRLQAMSRQRGLVVVVGDFRGPHDWQKPLTELGYRHQVIAVEIVDPRECEIPDVGEVVLMDPETGRQLRVDTTSPRLREAFADAAGAERAQVERALAAAGVGHLRLSTAGDWLRGLVEFLRRQRMVK